MHQTIKPEHIVSLEGIVLAPGVQERRSVTFFNFQINKTKEILEIRIGAGPRHQGYDRSLNDLINKDVVMRVFPYDWVLGNKKGIINWLIDVKEN